MRYKRNIPKSLWALPHICLALPRSPNVEMLPMPATSCRHARQISFAWSPELVTPDKKFTIVPDIVPVDTAQCRYKDALSNYAKASQLLKSNPPEQYPSLAYNSLEQDVTVITTQSALHEFAASELRKNITVSLEEYFSIYKLEAREGIMDSASSTLTSTRRQYVRSSKDPVGSFSYDDDEDGLILRVAIEAGFTENYLGLQRDIDMLIKGLDAKVVVLIFLQESPRFKSPNNRHNDIDIEHIDVELARMRQYMLEARRRNQERGTYGPIEYRNHTWSGNLKQARIEVWRRDMKEPVTSYLIKDGYSRDRLPTAIGLKISDFLTDRIWRSVKLPDCDVYFDGDRFMRSLTVAIYKTALERCINFVLLASV
ncbi:hypothetical protein V1506DRAFT_567567 [Lipomyces tetrasporus]